jgi:hypothetical protein
MSNLQSLFGGTVWAAVATLMLLATFERAPQNSSETQLAAAKVVAGYADV